MSDSNSDNIEKNKVHYEKAYANYSINNILRWLEDVDEFLSSTTSTHTSWRAIYHGGLQNRLKGKKVLEMGCGDCVNAAVMAALGAEVYANDIADSSGIIISKINAACDFTYPIKFISGDFLKNDLEAHQFDYVIGKAFLHHLTIPVEKLFLEETARLLKKDGEARFFEPAVNSKILDEIRWLIPVKGRPSRLNKTEFKKWKENDPHPDRSFSSSHFKTAGSAFFKDIEIIPIGTLERFNRLIPRGNFNLRYRKWALKKEQKLPMAINMYLTRSQSIIYKNPFK